MMLIKYSKQINIGLVIGLIVAGSSVFAPEARAAIAFNTFPVSYFAQTNHDYPLLDARNVTQNGSFSTSQSDHNDGVSANFGDIIQFQVYYHNSGVPEEQANNVIIRSVLPGGTRSSHEVSASISSDQTGSVGSSDGSRGGNITIYINGGAQTLEFIPGSTRHHPNRGNSGTQSLSNGDNITSGGVNIGSVRGCFEFSGFVSFQARVGSSSSVETRNLSINKRVLNVTRGDSFYQESVTAKPNDRLRFEILVQTAGNASQNNVIVRDILPTQLSFVSGTMRLDGSLIGSELELFGGGRNLGFLSAGTVRTTTFEANVGGAGLFSGSGATLVNTANVRSDQVSVRQDDTPITVSMVAGSQFTLRKTAFNLTQGVDAATATANPGDTIVYNLYYRNTGSVTNTGVVIEDGIQDVLELAQITNQGGAIAVNGFIRYAAVDVPPGVEVSRSFEVRIRPVAEWPAGTDQVMINIYGNEIRVPVRRTATPVTPVIPPRTGAGEWLAGILAVLVTGSYWAVRKSKFRRQT